MLYSNLRNTKQEQLVHINATISLGYNLIAFTVGEIPNNLKKHFIQTVKRSGVLKAIMLPPVDSGYQLFHYFKRFSSSYCSDQFAGIP